jgi:hypothetical protein
LKLHESFESFNKGRVKLSPNLIPHERFHLCDWWRVSDCDWWWWSSRSTPNLSIDSLSDVDPDLRGIVSAFWRRGIPTTPSCSGHLDFDTRRDALHSSIIQRIKTPSTHCFRGDLESEILEMEEIQEDWYDRICDYQRRGVLGWKEIGWESSIDWPCHSISDRGCFILVTESPDSWTEIEEKINNKLDEENMGFPGQSAPLSVQLYMQNAAPRIAI